MKIFNGHLFPFWFTGNKKIKKKKVERMAELTAEIWVETYCHIAEEIGARYHGDGYHDLNEDERLELIDFAEGILHSAGFTKGE